VIATEIKLKGFWENIPAKNRLENEIHDLIVSKEKKEAENRVEISFEGSMDTLSQVPLSLKLIGKTVDYAIDELEKYIDKAYRAGMPMVRIVHGYGTGRLQNAVVQFLKRNPLVEAARRGDRTEGGGGVTIAELRQRQ